MDGALELFDGPSMLPCMAKTPSIEKCFEAIEAAVEALEHEDLALNDAFTQYENGLKFLQQAKQQLDQYEARLETLNAALENEDDEEAS